MLSHTLLNGGEGDDHFGSAQASQYLVKVRSRVNLGNEDEKGEH